jgi:sulfatase modifying factor 1
VRELPAKLNVLFSSGPNQRAYESVLPEVQQGVFSYVLLRGLSGEAATEENEIVWLDLVAYVSRNVPKEVVRLAGKGLEQRPNYFGNQVATIVIGKTTKAKPSGGASTSKPRPAGDSGQFAWGTPKGQPPSGLLKDGFTAAELASVSEAWAEHLHVRVTDRTKLGNHQLRLIPPGEFQMGSSQVRITRPFFVGVYEVTRRQFKEFAESTGYRTEAEVDGLGGITLVDGRDIEQRADITWENPGFEQGPTHPVVQLSWNDAVAYCQWLTEVSQLRGELPTDWEFRLLTETEWEYACRAGYSGSYSFGVEPEELVRHGNVADASYDRVITSPSYEKLERSDGFVFTAPVGKYLPNRFGLYDLHGNVFEWCLDQRRINPISSVHDSRGKEAESFRVLRGGSWDSDAIECRSAYRDEAAEPSYRDATIGFRIALSRKK